MPSDIAAYVPCATCSETNSEFLMPPILPFMASSYDLLGNENFSGDIAIRGDGTLMYSNKEGFGKGGFGKGLSWRNGKVLKNTSLGKVACKTTRMAKGAPALSIVTGTVDVTLNARQYGFGSRQTYGAFGRAAGGILASRYRVFNRRRTARCCSRLCSGHRSLLWRRMVREIDI